MTSQFPCFVWSLTFLNGCLQELLPVRHEYIVSGSADAAIAINGFILSMSASLLVNPRTS